MESVIAIVIPKNYFKNNQAFALDFYGQTSPSWPLPATLSRRYSFIVNDISPADASPVGNPANVDYSPASLRYHLLASMSGVSLHAPDNVLIHKQQSEETRLYSLKGFDTWQADKIYIARSHNYDTKL